MTQKPEFDDIRPYYDEEVHPALQRIVNDELFKKIANYFYKDIPIEVLKEKLLSLRFVKDFQGQIMQIVIRTIIERTSDGVTFTGFESMNPQSAYLYVSNHRDILLDSSILQIILNENNFSTTEISFGSNLLINQFIYDFCKINRMFTIFRGVSGREFIKNSIHLSKYIRHTILEKKASVWIAQRNGRTKDGIDATDQGLIKMFLMGGDKDFKKSMSELNIVPVSISYEYEPCDFLKTQELYLTQSGKYEKKNGEDLNSVLTGILQPKGKINIAICNPINSFWPEIAAFPHINDSIKKIVQLMNVEIIKNYQLYKTNYIAYDLLYQTTKYAENYTPQQKTEFIAYADKGLAQITGEKEKLEELFYAMYANPVVSLEALEESGE